MLLSSLFDRMVGLFFLSWRQRDEGDEGDEGGENGNVMERSMEERERERTTVRRKEKQARE